VYEVEEGVSSSLHEHLWLDFRVAQWHGLRPPRAVTIAHSICATGLGS